MDDHEKAIKKEIDHNRVPDDLMELRACLVCSMIKNQHQFFLDGCDNCCFLEMKANKKRVKSCTTVRFSGFVGVTDTQGSWLCRWMHLETYLPGAYAVSVEGALPKEVRNMLHRKGIPYKSRNNAA